MRVRKAVVAALCIHGVVEHVRDTLGLVLDVGRGGDVAAVLRCRRNGAGIHQRNDGNLSLAGLAAFAVREVARGVTQRQPVVRRHVARAEARSAERRFDDRARFEQGFGLAVSRQRKARRNARRIHREGEVAVAGAAALQDVRSFHDVVEQTAGAARDHALIRKDALLADLALQIEMRLREPLLRFLLDLCKDLFRILEELVDRVRIGGMERQRDHGFDLVELDRDDRVVVCAFRGFELLVRIRALVNLVIFLDLVVGRPDRGKAGRFGRHDVDAAAEIVGQVLETGAGKLEDLVLHKTVGKRRLDKRERDVVRTDALLGRAGQITQHDFRGLDVVGVLQKLLDELRTAFADAHRAERAVTRVAVRAEDHVAAGGKLLTRVGMDDALVCRNVDAAVLLCRGETEDVVVLVDRAADGAKAVVAVGHGVRDREFLQSACARRLDDADVRDVVRDQRVKLDVHDAAFIGYAVRFHDLIGDRPFAALRLVDAFRCGNGRAVLPLHALCVILDHRFFSSHLMFELFLRRGRPHRLVFYYKSIHA